MNPDWKLNITIREAVAALVALISVAASSSYAYGVKSQQVQELQSIVQKHDAAILDLTKATADLRVAITELRVTIEHRKD